jgi:hypothetical protein
MLLLLGTGVNIDAVVGCRYDAGHDQVIGQIV